MSEERKDTKATEAEYKLTNPQGVTHNTPIVFISQNKDIIIEFTKEKVNRNFSFAKSEQEDRYLYTLTFKNYLGTIIKIIKLSDCEMYILLDNIYNFIYNKETTLTVSLSCKETTGEQLIFMIDSEIVEPELIAEYGCIQVPAIYKYNKNIFTIFQILNETVIKTISFEISNSIAEFANCIYNICIEGTDYISIPDDIVYTNIGRLIKPDFLL